jgi:hypothetical protein
MSEGPRESECVCVCVRVCVCKKREGEKLSDQNMTVENRNKKYSKIDHILMPSIVVVFLGTEFLRFMSLLSDFQKFLGSSMFI